ncbi:unnamed protein product [Chrysoparadoxa australica]
MESCDLDRDFPAALHWGPALPMASSRGRQHRLYEPEHSTWKAAASSGSGPIDIDSYKAGLMLAITGGNSGLLQEQQATAHKADPPQWGIAQVSNGTRAPAFKAVPVRGATPENEFLPAQASNGFFTTQSDLRQASGQVHAAAVDSTSSSPHSFSLLDERLSSELDSRRVSPVSMSPDLTAQLDQRESKSPCWFAPYTSSSGALEIQGPEPGMAKTKNGEDVWESPSSLPSTGNTAGFSIFCDLGTSLNQGAPARPRTPGSLSYSPTTKGIISRSSSPADAFEMLRSQSATYPFTSSPLAASPSLQVVGTGKESPPLKGLSELKLETDPLLASSAVAKNGASPAKLVYEVKFKRTTALFTLAKGIQPAAIAPGKWVVVEADRGIGLGCVAGTMPVEQFLYIHEEKKRLEEEKRLKAASSSKKKKKKKEEGSGGAEQHGKGKGSNPLGDLAKILRCPSEREMSKLSEKAEIEAEVVKVCKVKVKQRNLPMKLVDAEYQWDRNKLILFYESARRIDFRELVRDLFSVYKTRIWMEQAVEHECDTPRLTKLAGSLK